MTIYTDHRAAFLQYMANHGLLIRSPIIDDGQIHRAYIDGDKLGTRNGWYVLHPDGIAAGAFGSWRTGFQSYWCAASLNELTREQRTAHRFRLEQMRQQREADLRHRQQQAAGLATKLWSDATSADPNHPYLRRKGIHPHHLRQRGDLLLVPMIDADGTLHNLQRIHPDGSKRFLAGGRVKGCFTLFGEFGAGPIYICEGMATGATIHQHSGLTTVCAMNAGNLLTVCTALVDPTRQLTICADNDHRTQGNPGISKGREAAAAIGAALTWPDACGPSCTCTDFNDVATCQKAQGVAA